MQVQSYRFEPPETALASGLGDILGTHQPTGKPLRCRVLRGLAADAIQRRDFPHQIRAIAGLHHAHLAALLSAGEITDDQAPFAAGDLVLIYAAYPDGVPLDSLLSSLQWPRFCELLTNLCKALAFAHSRGLVHGRLQPHLIQCHPNAEPRTTLQIYDTGLWSVPALAVDPLAQTDYSAPEIGAGQIAAIGPHSDIYSLGLLAYRWLFGRLPHAPDDWPNRHAQHHFVPPELRAWIARCIAADPGQRFALAADALAALQALDRPAVDANEESQPKPAMPARWSLAAPATPPTPDWWWQFPELFAHRAPPTAGRHEAKETLWQILYQVRHNHRPRAVILSGAPGMGTHHLMDWISQRALEVGAARPLTLHHSSADRSTDGPLAMLARAFGLSTADSLSLIDELSPGLSRWTSALSGSQICQTLQGLVDQGTDSSLVGPAAAGWRQLLAALAQNRPLVIGIDNAHLASPTLDWLQALLEASQPLAVLFVLTISDQALAERPVEQVQLDELRQSPALTEIALEPLPFQDSLALIESLVPLDKDLAYEVVQRTAGNPLFITELLRHWVERKLLTPCPQRPHRLALSGPKKDQIPRQLLAVTEREIELFANRFGDAQAEDALAALEVAATLGTEVAFSQWRKVCEHLAIEIPPMLVRGLFASHLISESYESQTFSFRFAPAREVLLQRSRRLGRYHRIHHHCAQVLADEGDDGHWSWPGRMGVHLAAAGDRDQALDLLLTAARRLGNHGDPRRALTLLAHHRQICDELDLPPHDRRRLQGLIRQGWSHHNLGDLAAAGDVARRARQHLDTARHPDLEASLLWLEAGFAFDEGRLDDVAQKLAAARDGFEAQGDQSGMAKTDLRLGSHRRETGQFQAAYQHFITAKSLFDEIDDPRGVLIASQNAASILANLGRHDESESLLVDIIDGADEIDEIIVGDAYNSLGELYRAQQRWPQAQKAYAQAIAHWRRAHPPSVALAQINMAMALVEQGLFAQADRYLHQARQHINTAAPTRDALYLNVVAMACLAARRQWGRWCQLASSVDTFLHNSRLRSDDVANMLGISLERARRTAPEPILAWARKLRESQDFADAKGS